jgi:DNA replication protein DnaC
VQKWTCEAKLPAGKRFANLNLTELSASVQQQVIALKDLTDWLHHAGNVLLIGPSGVGKSHIAAALAAQLIEQKVRVKWLSAVTLVQSLQQAKRDLNLMTAMSRLDKYRS